jgi:hypothetical protein
MRKSLVLCLVVVSALVGCTQRFEVANQRSDLGPRGGRYGLPASVEPPAEPGSGSPPAGPTPTAMLHRSSMGALESDWGVAEIPAPFRGDWRLQPTADNPLPADYVALVFHLARSPADCRVYRDAPDGLREIGTLPTTGWEGDEFYAVFTGDFHLTYSLQMRRTVDGTVLGTFDHAGSGVVYFSGYVSLIAP